MKKLISILIVLFFLPRACLFSQSATVILHVTDAKTIINKNIYGHFAEHLGHCIYSGLYVGDSSQVIPNTDGVRNDIIAALKKLKVPVLRWPGGCFAGTQKAHSPWGQLSDP